MLLKHTALFLGSAFSPTLIVVYAIELTDAGLPIIITVLIYAASDKRMFIQGFDSDNVTKL